MKQINALDFRWGAILAGTGAFYLIVTIGHSTAARITIFPGPRMEIIQAANIIGAGFAGFTSGWIAKERGYLCGFMVATGLVIMQYAHYLVIASPRSIWEAMGGSFYAPIMVRLWLFMIIMGIIAGWTADKLKKKLSE